MSYLLRNQHRNTKVTSFRSLSSVGTQRLSVSGGSGQVQVQRLHPQPQMQQQRQQQQRQQQQTSGVISMEEGK
jgi:hypothetical protein